MPYDLFISYSRRDNAHGRITELVERIRADFKSFAKRELVSFFDQREITGMQDWRQRILQGLRESRLLLACLSPAYLKSEYCEWEFVEFLKYEIGHLHGFNGVAPIYFVEVPGWDSKEFEQQCAAWVAELRKRQHFDLRPWHAHGVEALRETAVQERMGKLNRRIADTITRGERAEKSLGNVDAHNPHFIGRTANLRLLRENFVTPGHIGVVTAVNGVGGLGKTALAIEYAHAFADEYGGGRWQVRCAGKDDLRLAFAELATPIGFEFTDDEKKNADLQFERTRGELKKLADAREPHRCLLILDNVDRPGLLDPAIIARLNGGDWLHVLATTRLGENELHGAHRDRSFLAIDELPPDDALALIESYQPEGRFGGEACPESVERAERDAAREIVRLLGCFTLAVESAAVYLGQFVNDVTCTAFLARLKKEGLEGLDTAASQSSEGVLHGEKRLSATLQPTLERLGAAEKLALEFAALLPPDQVPLPWLRALVAKTFSEMERDAEPGYPDPWKNVLRRLFSLRLIQATDEMDDEGQPRVVRIHRLIQQLITVHGKQSAKDRRTYLLEHANDRCQSMEAGWLEESKRWEIPPLLELATQEINRNQVDATLLVESVAWRLKDLGLRDASEKLIRKWLAVQEDILGYENASLNSIALLAMLLEEKGDLDAAESFNHRALKASQRLYGEDHPNTLICLNTEACLLESKGKYHDAESVYQKLLEAEERVLGEKSHHTMTCINNYGYCLWKKGDYDAAYKLLKRVIALRTSVFGADHPDTLDSVNILGCILQSKKQFAEAECYHRTALDGVERTLSADHPTSLLFRNDLAMALWQQSKQDEAVEILREALARAEKTLGLTHPRTCLISGNLAGMFEATGRFEEAAPLRQCALEGQEHRLGPEHPDALRGWNNHCVALRRQGLADLAEPIVRRVAATTARVFGESHSLTINRYANLVLTLIMLGKLAEARQILAANWCLNAPPHANTAPRIAFLRHIIAMLESQPDTPFLGQLKTLLTGPELPVASDVAVLWDIAYFIEFLKPKLGEHNAEFLTALVAALNDRSKLSALDQFPEWRDATPQPLD